MTIDQNFFEEFKNYLQYLDLIVSKNHHQRIVGRDFIGIMENGDATPISSTPIVFESTQYGLIISRYVYAVKSQDDYSFYAAFITPDGIKEQLVENGWTLNFDVPITSMYRTYNRCCYISKGNLNIELRFKDLDILTKIGDCIKFFRKAQDCSAQEELNLLKNIYEQKGINGII